jgi:uncharacterized protein (TIGR03437 family)
VEFWDDSNVAVRASAQIKAFLPEETRLASAYYRHESVLGKLEPGTTYYYRVLMDGQTVASQGLRFRTPGTQPFEFLALGDSVTGSPQQRQIAARMLMHDAAFVVHTGDLVYPAGSYERYDSLYFQYYRDLMRDAPFFPCPGNHDYYETHCIPYRAVHSLPEERVAASDYGRYYSFDWGNGHFISLDSNDALNEAVFGSGGMLTWLDNDLRQTNKFWRIVFLHHPAYSVGKHCDEPEAQLVREYIAPVLDRYSVPLVFNGHEHSYQRSAPVRAGQVVKRGEGTVYITTGGGGAELHPVGAGSSLVEMSVSEHHYLSCGVNGTRVQIKALRPDGSELDAAVVAPKPVLQAGGVVNSASFTPNLASGGLVSVFGFQFSPDEITPLQYPLPKSAAGTAVLLDDKPLPILMASANQVNVQLPFDVSGAATITVRTPNGTASLPVTIHAAAPALFPDSIFHADGVPVSADSPAKAGEEISVYLTGLGDVLGEATPGEAAKSYPALAPVRLRLNDRTFVPEFAGLAAGVAGIDVVTFRMPPGFTGLIALKVIAAGSESNPLMLAAA